MKVITTTTARRTAPSAWRHNQRERERRELHAGRIWLLVTRIDRPVGSLSSIAGYVPRGMHIERAIAEDYGHRLVLHLAAVPGARSPIAKPGQSFTNWRHAHP